MLLKLKAKILEGFFILMVLAGGYAWAFHNGYEHKEKEIAAEQVQADKALQARYNKVADDYETLKTKRENNVRTITKTVEKLVDNPVYRNICISDTGLHVINQALSGNLSTRSTNDEMP